MCNLRTHQNLKIVKSILHKISPQTYSNNKITQLNAVKTVRQNQLIITIIKMTIATLVVVVIIMIISAHLCLWLQPIIRLLMIMILPIKILLWVSKRTMMMTMMNTRMILRINQINQLNLLKIPITIRIQMSPRNLKHHKSLKHLPRNHLLKLENNGINQQTTIILIIIHCRLILHLQYHLQLYLIHLNHLEPLLLPIILILKIIINLMKQRI